MVYNSDKLSITKGGNVSKCCDKIVKNNLSLKANSYNVSKIGNLHSFNKSLW